MVKPVEILTRITTLQGWGRDVLSQKARARKEDVLEVLTLGLELEREIRAFTPLTGSYWQVLEDLRPYWGTLLILSLEDLTQAGIDYTNGLPNPWGIHSSELYVTGLRVWAQTLGVSPLEVWYSFKNPGNPPKQLTLNDGSWNPGVTAEQLRRAFL